MIGLQILTILLLTSFGLSVKFHPNNSERQTFHSVSDSDQYLYRKLFSDEQIVNALNNDPHDPKIQKLILDKIVQLAKNDPKVTKELSDNLFAKDSVSKKANLTEEQKMDFVRFIMSHPGMMRQNRPTQAQFEEWLKEDSKAQAVYRKIKRVLGEKSHCNSIFLPNINRISHKIQKNHEQKSGHQELRL